MRRIITVIPARGGSKGVSKKNIQHIAGKPLLAYAIEKARQSDSINKLVVSTDTEDIASVAIQYGAEVPFLRPPELSSDTATLLEVSKHVLDYFDHEGDVFDAVLSLQVTAPLLKTPTIDRAISVFRERNAECVVTISEIRHGHPVIAKKLMEGDILQDFIPNVSGFRYPRQVRDKAYYPSGGLFIRDRALLENPDRRTNGFGSRPMGILISPEESLNIDDEFDLKLARALMQINNCAK